MGETFWRLTDEFAPYFLCVSIQPDYGFDWDQLEHNMDRNSLCRSCLQERGLDRRLERSLIITPINWYYNHYIQQTLTKKKDAIPLNVILSKPFICTDDNLFEWSAMPYKLWNSTRNVETHKAIAISTLFSKVCMRDDINPWDWLPLVPIPLL